MIQHKNEEVDEFLNESNKIEGVFDDLSFIHASHAWNYLMTQKIMTIGVVKKTHKMLMMISSGLMPDQRGYFRKIPVWVGGREGVDHKKIKERMDEWCAAMNSTNPTHDYKTLHVIYENIHPFVDGNGRTGRMFMNWHRIKILGLPLLTIKARERWEYYKWFK